MNELHPDLARVIISEEDIQARVTELARQIDKDYTGINKIYVIGILKGAVLMSGIILIPIGEQNFRSSSALANPLLQ